jgi:fructosamine-3-kinase
MNKKIIPEYSVYTKLSGGTTSEVYLVDSRYVIKKNEPQVLEAEALFLKQYSEIAFFPKPEFQHKLNQYIVYTFIEGDTVYKRKNKCKILVSLVQNVINQYKLAPSTSGWGWSDEPSKSWHEFLLQRANIAKGILQNYLKEEDSELVYSLINIKEKEIDEQPYLLHGDCGAHNFIFSEGNLTGVIDPTPVTGPRIYDLLYAFCSTPDDLIKETIETAAKNLLGETKNLEKDVLIILYLRMATCMKYHPDDFAEYLVAWEYWKRQL